MNITMYKELKNILLKKFSDLKLIEKKENNENNEIFWINMFDVSKIIEMNYFPYPLNSRYIKNGVKYVSSDNLLKFLMLSENPHHIIDYLIPMNLPYKNTPLLEVVNLFDKYGIRGIYNYDMSKCSNCLNFSIKYYYHCPIPLLIDICSENQDPFREQLFKMFETQNCKCVQINVADWETCKNIWLSTIESHLVKLNAITFMSKIIKNAEEIKNDVDELGEDVIDAICAGDEFPFSLSKCMKKFRITETNPKYKEIMSLFETEKNISDINDNLETIEDETEIDLTDDTNVISHSNSLEDTELCEDLEKMCFVTTQLNDNTTYIAGQDYMTLNGEYYLNHPTLIKIAIKSGVRRAEQYVDKTWNLVQYISKYGEQAYSSLLKTVNMSPSERKDMFTFSQSTLEKNKTIELEKAKLKIEELKSFIDINKTKKQIEHQQIQYKLECDKFYNNSDDVFVVEKTPTKVRPSSIITKTKGPINQNELESFLGLT